MLKMLRFDGEVWEIALGFVDVEGVNVSVRKPIKGRDDKAIAAGIDYVQSDGRFGKNIKAHEIRQIS